MADLLDALAPYISEREALTESIHLHIFQSRRAMEKFQEVAGLDGRSTLRHERHHVYPAVGVTGLRLGMGPSGSTDGMELSAPAAEWCVGR